MARKSIYGYEYFKGHRVVRTLGELRALLKDVPDSVPLDMRATGMNVACVNVGTPSEHIAIEENYGEDE